MELLQDKIKSQVENLKLNLLEENNKQKSEIDESNNKNENDLNEGNLKIDEQKSDKNEDDDFDDFKKDWVIYDNEEALSVNLNENEEKEEKVEKEDKKDENDIFNDYEIIESYNEKDENITTSKKVEV